MLFGVLIVSLLYATEFVENYSSEYTNSQKEFLYWKKENGKALSLVKKNAKGTEVYKDYTKVNAKYNKAKADYNRVKQEEKVSGFKSLQLFLYELLPTIALFAYFLYNLYRSFRLERNSLGPKIIHSILIMFVFFKLFWIFKTFQDFSKPTYYLMTIFSAYFVGLAVFLIEKKQAKKSNKIKKKLLKVSYHALKNVKEEKLEEMAKVIEKPM